MPEKLLAPVTRVVDGKLMVAAGGAPSTANVELLTSYNGDIRMGAGGDLLIIV